MGDNSVRDYFPLAAPAVDALGRMVPSMRLPDASALAADALGAPVDGMAWILRRAGLPVPGGTPGMGRTSLAPVGWAPNSSVPFSGEYFREAFNNPSTSLDALRRALPRGLF